MMEDEHQDYMGLDVPLEPAEYPPALRTVADLLERAIRLADANPSDVLSQADSVP